MGCIPSPPRPKLLGCWLPVHPSPVPSTYPHPSARTELAPSRRATAVPRGCPGAEPTGTSSSPVRQCPMAANSPQRGALSFSRGLQQRAALSPWLSPFRCIPQIKLFVNQNHAPAPASGRERQPAIPPSKFGKMASIFQDNLQLTGTQSSSKRDVFNPRLRWSSV